MTFYETNIFAIFLLLVFITLWGSLIKTSSPDFHNILIIFFGLISYFIVYRLYLYIQRAYSLLNVIQPKNQPTTPTEKPTENPTEKPTEKPTKESTETDFKIVGESPSDLIVGLSIISLIVVLYGLVYGSIKVYLSTQSKNEVNLKRKPKK